MLAKWHGHVTADEVIEAASGYLAYLQQYPCSKLLNDKSNVTGDWQDANDWLEYDWLPKAYDAGLRCMAHIYSLSMFSQLSALDLQQRVVPPLQMKNFTDFDTALNWVLHCENNEKPLPTT